MSTGKHFSSTLLSVASIIKACSLLCLPMHCREKATSAPTTHHLAPTSVYPATCVLIKTQSAAGETTGWSLLS